MVQTADDKCKHGKHSYRVVLIPEFPSAPIKETMADFWWMVWQLRCSRIVMLTSLQEGTKVGVYVQTQLWIFQ